MNIGILALQGAFIEHVRIIERLGVNAKEIRLADDLCGIDGMIIPGGESTTILKLMHGYQLFEPLRKKILNGFPVWGTCAGLICLAKKVSNSQHSFLQPLEVMDIQVKRNAFGRQVDSFEIDLSIPVLGTDKFHAIFIRAPLISEVGKEVEILAKLENGTIVAARQANLLVSSFHPELTDDFRFHQYFIRMTQGEKQGLSAVGNGARG